MNIEEGEQLFYFDKGNLKFALITENFSHVGSLSICFITSSYRFDGNNNQIGFYNLNK